MRIVEQTVSNALHIALYSDELLTKVRVNWRTSDGVLHQGIYRAIHTKEQGNFFQVLYYTLWRMRKRRAKFIFIYSNDSALDKLRPGENNAITKRDKHGQVKSAIKVELFNYAQGGGWYLSIVAPEAIPTTRDMLPE